MKKKKNRFLLFLCSLVPGAGEMYLGFMKMGVSILLGFMLSIAVVAFTMLDWLAVIPVTIYVYAFFHANNLGGLDDAAFEAMEDEYLFGMDALQDWKFKLTGKYRTASAVVLIIIGISMLWNVVLDQLLDIFGWENVYLSVIYSFIESDLPRMVIGIAVIWAGIVMIRGKKAAPDEDSEVKRITADEQHDN